MHTDENRNGLEKRFWKFFQSCILDLRCPPNEHISVYIFHFSISTAVLIESVRPAIPLAPDPADIFPSVSEIALQLFDNRTSSLPAMNYENLCSIMRNYRLMLY